MSCNPGVSPDAVSPVEAVALLERITSLPNHEFWADDLSLREAVAMKPLVSHRQVTDAYLLALAEAHGGKLATLDRSVLSLPDADNGLVELLLG